MNGGNVAYLQTGGSGVQTILVDEILDGEAGYARGPERSLMSALLFDGVMGYMCYAAGNRGEDGEGYAEAFRWVHTKDSDYIFSFENVCEGLGIDPGSLRLGLINAANSKRGEWKRSRRKEV